MSRGRTRRVNVDPREPIPWRVLQDKRISFRARGILGYLLSLPDGWEASAERIAHETTEGRDAVATALKELERVGYLARRKYQAAAGKWAWIWLYSDTPEDLAKCIEEELSALGMATLDATVTGETVDGIPGDGVTSDNDTSSQVEPSTGYPSTVHPSTDFQGTKKELSTGEPSTQETKNPPRPPQGGTRLPDDFTVSAEMKTWAAKNAPLAGWEDHAEWVDYWRSVPGQKGRKLDWEATWRNGMRRAQQQHERNGGRRQRRTNLDGVQQESASTGSKRVDKARRYLAQGEALMAEREARQALPNYSGLFAIEGGKSA